jgi:(p)ppGpp synthase/HD superfamily hydrolase
MRYPYAQTNLQLYGQLVRSGYSDEQLLLVRNAYDLAVQLFTASFRGSGKPLIAHLVGTASILAWINQSPAIVAAGLLHAAYALGDFGGGRNGITPAKRDRVRRVVGADVEDLIAAYTNFDWNRQTIPGILARMQALSPRQRDVLVIRLANELEDHLDSGVLYCGNAEQRREFIRSPLNQSVDMARYLGLDSLAAALEAAFAETVSAELPGALQTAHGYTFVQSPASHSPRPIVVVRRYLDRHPRIGRAMYPIVAWARAARQRAASMRAQHGLSSLKDAAS